VTRILVVEDEESFSDPLSYLLRKEGFEVEVADDGPSALAEFDRTGADLVLLDLMLPGLPGTEVCRQLRLRSNVPVIMLTAKDSEVDKVVGLELGADDYVAKPFSPRELLARIRAVLRRAQPDTVAEKLSSAGITVDTGAREAWVDTHLRLAGPAVHELQETFVEEDGPGWARKQRPWNLVALAATLALGLWMWSLVGPWRLVLDRRARVVTLRAPLGRRRRSTEELAGVQVRTPLIDQIEALRRKRRPMPWAQASVARCRLVFLDAAAEAWPVTPWLQHGEAARQLDALAERVSEHLRLPLVPAPQVPRPGAVPPARPSARAAP